MPPAGCWLLQHVSVRCEKFHCILLGGETFFVHIIVVAGARVNNLHKAFHMLYAFMACPVNYVNSFLPVGFRLWLCSRT